MQGEGKRAYIWTGLVMLTVVLFFYQEALLASHILSFRDLSRYFFPLRSYSASLMREGVLPLWNPYIFSGFPHFAALQTCVLYPLSALYYLLPFDIAFNWFLIIHVFLFGLFTCFLAREWGLTATAALIAGLTAMLNGYTSYSVSLPTTLGSMTWLPLILITFHKSLIDASTSRYWIITSALLATMFLGGEPSIFYATAWILFLYALLCAPRRSPKEGATRRIVRSFGATARPVAAALSLAAFQLFPFAEFLAKTDRLSQREAFTVMTTWSLKLKNLPDLLIPFFAGTDTAKAVYYREQMWVPVIYIGAFTLLFAALALLRARDRRTGFLALVAALFLFLALGSSTPFYGAISSVLPGLRSVRYPVRFLFATEFAFSLLAGFGYSIIERSFDRGAPRTGRVSFFLVLAGCAALALFLTDTFTGQAIACVRMMLQYFGKEGAALGKAVIAARVDLRNVERLLIFLVVGPMILWAGSSLKARRGVTNFALVSLVVADFCTATGNLQKLCAAPVVSLETPNIRFVRSQLGLFRVHLSPKTRASNDFIDGTSYEDAMMRVKDKFIADQMVGYGISDIRGYESLQLGNYKNFVALADDPLDSRILDLLNVRYVVTLDPLARDGFEFAHKGFEASLYRNTRELPRAFLVKKHRVARTGEEARAYITSKAFDPGGEVVLQGGRLLEAIEPEAKEAEGAKRTDERCEIAAYSPHEVLVKVSINGPRFLVLSDQYYPGWKAFVDGVRSEIYQADFVLRAVRLSKPGDHLVKFVYDPLSLKMGTAVSVGTAVVLMLTLFASRRKRGKRLVKGPGL